MANGEPLVFEGISLDQYARLTAKAKDAGIDLSGNNGSATRFGVEVSWSYSPSTQELVLQCLKTSFFISPVDVNARLESLVKESIA